MKKLFIFISVSILIVIIIRFTVIYFQQKTPSERFDTNSILTEYKFDHSLDISNGFTQLDSLSKIQTDTIKYEILNSIFKSEVIIDKRLLEYISNSFNFDLEYSYIEILDSHKNDKVIANVLEPFVKYIIIKIEYELSRNNFKNMFSNIKILSNNLKIIGESNSLNISYKIFALKYYTKFLNRLSLIKFNGKNLTLLKKYISFTKPNIEWLLNGLRYEYQIGKVKIIEQLDKDKLDKNLWFIPNFIYHSWYNLNNSLKVRKDMWAKIIYDLKFKTADIEIHNSIYRNEKYKILLLKNSIKDLNLVNDYSNYSNGLKNIKQNLMIIDKFIEKIDEKID